MAVVFQEGNSFIGCTGMPVVIVVGQSKYSWSLLSGSETGVPLCLAYIIQHIF